ncbi:MAG: hypothetical protein ACLS9K_03765 [Lachnospira eligens]
MFLLRMLVKVYMKHRNGGKRTTVYLLSLLKTGGRYTFQSCGGMTGCVVSGIVITDEDMTVSQ